jgi:hypothetical protein
MSRKEVGPGGLGHKETVELIENIAESVVDDQSEVNVEVFHSDLKVTSLTEGSGYPDLVRAVAEFNDDGIFPKEAMLQDQMSIDPGATSSYLCWLARGPFIERRRWSDEYPYTYRVTDEGRDELERMEGNR